MPALELRDVWFRYGGSEDFALRGVSLGVDSGEVLAIIGANGSGKTTLIKHMNGLLRPTRGDAYVYGINTRRSSVGELSKLVAVVFQNPQHQLFSETVLEEVMFGLRNFGVRDYEGRAEEVLREFGLYEERGRAPSSLSGGERKRLCVASVMGWRPRALVLDEPTVGQDAVNKAKLIGLIKLWSARGMAIVLASHDAEFIWSLAPRAVVMERGSIVGSGPAREVLSDEDLAQRAGFRVPQLAELRRAFELPEAPATPKEAAMLIVRRLGGT